MASHLSNFVLQFVEKSEEDWNFVLPANPHTSMQGEKLKRSQLLIISTTVCEKNKRVKHDAHFYNDIWSWKKNQNWPNFLNSHQKQILFAFWISISFHLFVFFRQVQCQLTEKKKKKKKNKEKINKIKEKKKKKKKSYGQINQISRIYQWKQIFV